MIDIPCPVSHLAVAAGTDHLPAAVAAAIEAVVVDAEGKKLKRSVVEVNVVHLNCFESLQQH